MASVSDEPVFARNPIMICVEVGDDVVVLDSKRWNYLDFDDIGSRIWVLLKEPRTLSALVEELIQEFAVNRALCRRDTELFLEDLIKKSIVIKREPGEHAAG